MMMRKLLIALPAILALAACQQDDADIASRNLSKAADNFEVNRTIVFYNIWTDTEIVTVEGKCSLEIGNSKLAVVCKDGPNDFKKHYLGRSANLSFFARQMDPADVSVNHTRITWKPQAIFPDIDLRGDANDLVTNRH